MYNLVVNIEKQYDSFTNANNSDGYCVGFCLKWLGDVLNKNKSGYRNGAYFVDVRNRAELMNLMERAKKKHQNHIARCMDYKKKVGKAISQMEFAAKYNDRKQREFENKTHQPGLHYKYSDFMNTDVISGIDGNFSSSINGQGIMISFSFDCNGQRVSHVIAVVRSTPEQSYLFDPNAGLYSILSANPSVEIKSIISRNYSNHRLLTQTTVH